MINDVYCLVGHNFAFSPQSRVILKMGDGPIETNDASITMSFNSTFIVDYSDMKAYDALMRKWKGREYREVVCKGSCYFEGDVDKHYRIRFIAPPSECDDIHVSFEIESDKVLAKYQWKRPCDVY